MAASHTLRVISEAVYAGLLSEKKLWARTLPKPVGLLPQLLGAAAWPTYQPLFLLAFILLLFYVKLMGVTRLLTACGAHPLRAPSLLRNLQWSWGLVSSIAGLAVFMADAFITTGGGAKLLMAVLKPSGEAAKARTLRLTATWALTFIALCVDCALSLLALAPLFLRLAARALPGLAKSAYPQATAEGEAAAAAPGGGKGAALGTKFEALRRLDSAELLVGRLLELALLFAFHKYQR